MKTHAPASRLTTWLPCLLLLGAFVLNGCKTSVEVLDVSGPDSLRVDETGTFEATVNEDASEPITYRWSYAETDIGPDNPITYAFGQPGAYTVEVAASNRNGKATDTGQTSVVVFEPPVPAEIVALSADPTNPDTRTSVHFQTTVQGDTPIAYSWRFGDGTTGSGVSPTHTYSEAGTYTVELQASNDAGSDTRTMSVTVALYEADYCSELTEMNAAFFERNSSTLTEDGHATLEENLRIMEDCPNLSVRVEGLAGPLERNPQQLSTDRARAVEQFYVANGVTAGRVLSQGNGRTGEAAKKSGGEQFRRVDTIPLQQRSGFSQIP